VSTYAIALSVGLQHRVPLAELIRPGLDQYFMPNGSTDDPEIPRVWSAIDYIARRLAIDWLPYCDRAALGVYTLAERPRRRTPAAHLSAPGLPSKIWPRLHHRTSWPAERQLAVPRCWGGRLILAANRSRRLTTPRTVRPSMMGR